MIISYNNVGGVIMMSAPKRTPIEKAAIKGGGGNLSYKDPIEGLKVQDKKAQKKIRDRGF